MTKSLVWGVLMAAALLASPQTSQAEKLSNREEAQKAEVLKRFRGEANCRTPSAFLSTAASRSNNAIATWRVRGCQKSTTYLCRGTLCSRDTEMRTSGRKNVDRYAPRLIAKRTERKGKEMLLLKGQIPFKDVRLLVMGIPEAHANDVVLRVTLPDGPTKEAKAKACRQSLVVGGNPFGLPAPKVTMGRRGLKQEVVYEFQLPISDLISIAAGSRIAGRSCETTWRLDNRAIEVLREFVMRFREEIVLLGGVPPADVADVADIPADGQTTL